MLWAKQPTEDEPMPDPLKLTVLEAIWNWVVDNRSFVFSALFAIVITCFWAYRRFDEPTFEQKKADPATMLRPSDLVTPQGYLKGTLAYAAMLIAWFCITLALGPKVLKPLGLSEQFVQDDTFPLVIVLILTGVIPNIKGVRDLEEGIRRVGHAIAGIPRDIQMLAEALSTAKMDRTHYLRMLHEANVNHQGPATAPLTYVTVDDLTAEGKPFQTWTRLCCLASSLSKELSYGRRFVGNTRIRLKEEFDALNNEIEQTAQDVEEFRKLYETNCNIRMNNTLRDRINDLNRRLTVSVVIVALHGMGSEEKAKQAFAEIGFVLPSRTGGIRLVDIGVMVFALMFLALVVIMAIWWLMIRNDTDVIKQVAPLVPHDLLSISAWFVNTLVQAFGASMIALSWRCWRISQHRWNDRPLDYFIVTVGSALLTLILMMLGDLTVKAIFGDWITLNSIQFVLFLPFAIPMLVTAFFVLVVLRGNGPQHSTARRCAEAVAFAAPLGAIAIITGILIYNLQLPFPENPPDAQKYIVLFVIFSAVMSGACGAIIGLVVPHMYRMEITRVSRANAAF
jgi:hypothetical protein